MGAILRVTPPDAAAWDIAIGAPNWWRSPVSTQIAFISEWRGYLADVVERRVVGSWDAIRVSEAELHDLVLFCAPESIVAVGRDGVAWETGVLVDDDLKVDAVHRDAIRCSGWRDDRRVEFALDPATGALL